MTVFELKQGRIRLFKTLCLRDASIYINYGRVGNKGRISQQHFNSTDEAGIAFENAVKQLGEEGYSKIDDGDGVFGNRPLPYRNKLDMRSLDGEMRMCMQDVGVDPQNTCLEPVLAGFKAFAKRPAHATKRFTLHWRGRVTAIQKQDEIEFPYVHLSLRVNLFGLHEPRYRSVYCHVIYRQSPPLQSLPPLTLDHYVACDPLIEDFRETAQYSVLASSPFELLDIVS